MDNRAISNWLSTHMMKDAMQKQPSADGEVDLKCWPETFMVQKYFLRY